MNPFPDTSFLFAAYYDQVNSERADRLFSRLAPPLHVSSLLLLEFRQSLRLQIALRRQDKTKGMPHVDAMRILEDVKHDLDAGLLHVAEVEWVEVHSIAERISASRTVTGRHRLVDILHVATCLHLGAKEFLTFDENQKRLAQAEGLKVLL